MNFFDACMKAVFWYSGIFPLYINLTISFRWSKVIHPSTMVRLFSGCSKSFYNSWKKNVKYILLKPLKASRPAYLEILAKGMKDNAVDLHELPFSRQNSITKSFFFNDSDKILKKCKLSPTLCISSAHLPYSDPQLKKTKRNQMLNKHILKFRVHGNKLTGISILCDSKFFHAVS